MSLLSQFFPSGGGGSNIHLELLAVSGGGGTGGGPNSFGNFIIFRAGAGGGGAAYQGMLKVAPGSTVPITIGAGGAANPTSPCSGSRGGDTVVKYPEGTIRVMGGGGGLGANQTALDPASPAHGGTGGGGGCFNKGMSTNCNFYMFNGPPSNETTKEAVINRSTGRSIYAKGNVQNITWRTNSAPTLCLFFQQEWNGTTMSPYGDGAFYGAPGNLMFNNIGNPSSCHRIFPGSGGGGAGGQGFMVAQCCSPFNGLTEVAGPGIFTEMTGTMEEFGRGGINSNPTIPNTCLESPANSGQGGSNKEGGNLQAGGSGVVIIRYPTDFAAAPSSPGATDCSPATPGYRTYRFNSSGSITLP